MKLLAVILIGREAPPPGLERLQTVLLTPLRSVAGAATTGLES